MGRQVERAEKPYGDRVVVVDKSAWERAHHPHVREEWTAAMLGRQMALSSATKLEILYSARSSEDFDRLAAALDELRHAPLDEGVARTARGAMRALARRASHRIPIADYLVAASAQERSLDVLHYDHHFDLLAEVLTFDSVWLAPPGTL
ncbi:MAG: PIN domain-containing protein [Solirubrobacteraceae bacterium MAG38_C4-C5]|nr:PIN domain-containing protein [Candidatus Siliceabacter maunaloa]